VKKYDLKNRQYIILFLMTLGALVIFLKLINLQLINDVYKEKAERNVIRQEILYPVRGSIYDRNGELLVGNIRAFDLMVTPRYTKEFDTTLLAKLTDSSVEIIKKKLKKAQRYSRHLASPVIKNIEKKEGMMLLEKINSFPGFELQERTTRFYPYGVAANILGYISQVPPQFQRDNPYYHRNDNIGRTGVERTYEKDLRGEKGEKFYYKDRFGRSKGSYKNGELNKKAKSGKDLTITLDWKLQDYAQQLMDGKKGAVVAIEPSSGEVLSIVSSPTYDPNLLVGRRRTKNYNLLEKDTLLPLYDRALQGQYPPGSTFKLVNALIGLQEGTVTEYSKFPCHHGWYYSPRLKVGCHSHYSPLALRQSIAQSCNGYYCALFHKMIDKDQKTKENYTRWREYVKSFGFGNYLGNDFDKGSPGKIPSVADNDSRYPKLWKAPTVISLSIGQDALLATPIQMANMAAAIANRGYFYTPHIIKEKNGESIEIERFTKPKKINIDKKHFETVIDGMQLAVEGKIGVATSTGARIQGITVCGKTGTAQNVNKDKDHSIFIAFAPRENPKIAIAVYVENAGWGSSYGVPIASLIMERYLKGHIVRQELSQKMINTNLLETESDEES
jgi:penicillin-binding protein 2